LCSLPKKKKQQPHRRGTDNMADKEAEADAESEVEVEGEEEQPAPPPEEPPDRGDERWELQGGEAQVRPLERQQQQRPERPEIIDRPDFEIVGIAAGNNGRSCCQHEVCGNHLHVGDVCRVVRCIVTINNVPEDALKIVKIADGTDTCTVGFVPRAFKGSRVVQDAINGFVQVLEIYADSTNTTKRRLAHKNHGMASVMALNYIPQNE
jgi:hypothetical protein